jgi:hypothetical protein
LIKNRLLRRRVRLLEMIDLADMLGGMRELEAEPLAMPAGRKAAAVDEQRSTLARSGHFND